MIPKTKLLTEKEIAGLLDYPTAIRVVRQVFKAYARGQATMPPKVYLPLPGKNDFRAMPAYLAHPPSCGLKWVNVHPHNVKYGLPSVMAVIVVNDPKTGVPLAIMDGRLITKMRTAAAAAVAAKALAKAGSHRVGLVGCGGQADAQLLALAEVFRLTEVNVWGYLSGEARRFCSKMRLQLPRIRWQTAETVKDCAHQADILVTITPSRRPIVKQAWLTAGVHINAIGADGPGKQELDPAILRSARVYVDDYEQAIHGGEINVPVAKRQYDPKRIYGSLGEVLLKRKTGRLSDKQVTVFDSTGLAIHDVALGCEVMQKAFKRRVGRNLALMS